MHEDVQGPEALVAALEAAHLHHLVVLCVYIYILYIIYIYIYIYKYVYMYICITV